MFTGLIERLGRVVSLTSEALDGQNFSGITRLVVDPGADFETQLGDSVAINGCCLTVAAKSDRKLTFDLSAETLARTALARLKAGQTVNLERAMRLGDRLGGHLVSGHVDTVGAIAKLDHQAGGWFVQVSLPATFARYVIAKGSVCIDGVSLTVNDLKPNGNALVVDLMLIPVTVTKTAFQDAVVGQAVNIEVDLVGKYLEKLALPYRP